MPRLSDSMAEGVIACWTVDDGASVKTGDEIVEIETDKTNVAFEAEFDGVLRHGAREGDAVAVGAPIGSIEPQVANTARRRRLAASPTAMRLAEKVDVTLDLVVGSGVGGRVLRRDVITAHESRGARRPVQPARRVPLTRAHRLVADRMSKSKNTIPEFTVTRDVDFGAGHAFREKLRAKGEPVPSYNDIVVAAAARTLADHPLLTARFDDGHIVYADAINIAIAVATDTVLHAPVLRGANLLPLNEITTRSRRLTELARQGGLSIDDVVGGTFTISNLGMYGVRQFTAVINAGQVAILAVGGVREDVVVHDGAIRVGWRAELTLTCDHRVVYGVHAANFLRDLDARLKAVGPAPL